ncbi:hypothetical protein KUCAC02_019340 [Chaenocephalus aceratus]|nr:hypothetical protein KUCAC02_019340 [Chaenocephalus aceratus]
MYYVRLTIESSAIPNITERLGETFVNETSLQVDKLTVTTVCQSDAGSRECSCSSNFRWSEEGCDLQEKCTFPKDHTPMCVHSDAGGGAAWVLLLSLWRRGSLGSAAVSLEEGQLGFCCCLSEGGAAWVLLLSLLRRGSLGSAAVSLEEGQLGVGSVIVEFALTVAQKIGQKDLVDKSDQLTRNVNASLDLESSGVIKLTMPASPVCFTDQPLLSCQLQEPLGVLPVWQLSRDRRASALMDLALLPDILISTEPGFPKCDSPEEVLSVKVICEIEKNTENYTVTWAHEHLFNAVPSEETKKTFTADAIVTCTESGVPTVTCNFANRCNETTSATVDINIIYEGEKFCPADGDWGNTKDLNDVLKNAENSDIGLGSLDENAADVFSQLDQVTNNSQKINSYANLNASVQDFFDSSSNLLEESLKDSWIKKSGQENISLAERYLSSVEKLIDATNVTQLKKKKNIEVMVTNCTKQNTKCYNKVFNVSVILKSSNPGKVKSAGFKELEKYLPQKDNTLEPNSIVVSTTMENKISSVEVEIRFPLLRKRPPHVLMKCVAWDNATRDWSEDGCKWSGASDEGLCTCKHLSSFAILMQRYPLKIDGLHRVTQVGLAVSVVSLVTCLIIEVLVWSSVVKTNTLYLRHTAHINISLCLLVADCCFLASMDPESVSELWCRIFVVLKHFCFLSMFFWMLCLSGMLLHQAVFLFHNVSKRTYLRLSMFLGYVCPLLIVVITFLVYDGGIEGEYFSKESCWLLYEGLMKGSIHTFVIPVGIIVFVNVLSMMVVIMKLLDHPKNAERTNESEKKAAVTVMRSVILLTPIFGVTWVFGFAVMLMDLTSGPIAITVNYLFTLLNAFQTREALGKRLKTNASAPTSSSTTKLQSTWKK